MMLTNLADVLRAAGLNVVEEAGWKARGAPFRSVAGLVLHHTGPGPLAGQIRVVRDGRPDLPGPLSQIVLAEDGTCHVIAAGRSNHSGRGNWQGVTDGNARLIGIEADNSGDGIDVWEPAQMHAFALAAAAIAEAYGFPAHMICGHKEYALPKGRKIDPNFDVPTFRALVADIMNDAVGPGAGALPPLPPKIATLDPKRAMLQLNAQGPDVILLQTGLRALGYKVAANGVFSWETHTRVREFQRAQGLTVDGLFGPASWTRLFELRPELKDAA